MKSKIRDELTWGNFKDAYSDSFFFRLAAYLIWEVFSFEIRDIYRFLWTHDRAKIFKSPRSSVSKRWWTAALMPAPASYAKGKTSNTSFSTTMALYTCMNSLVEIHSMKLWVSNYKMCQKVWVYSYRSQSFMPFAINSSEFIPIQNVCWIVGHFVRQL